MSRSRPDARADADRSHEPLILLKENRPAQAALWRMLSNGRPRSAWLALLYGPSGTGKSHLVRHLVREARRQKPPLRALCVTVADFVGEFDDACLHGRQADFEAKYIDTDLLVLEDLGAIRGRLGAQRTLIVLFDELKRAGARIVVTSSSLPGQIKRLQPRLANRLRGGVCIPLEPLDQSSRLAFARHMAACRQIPVSSEAIEILAREGPSTARELLAALVSLDLGTRTGDREPDAKRVRAHLNSSRPGGPCTLSEVAKAVARFYRVPLAALRASSRRRQASVPRQVAMFLARELSSRPAAAIARYFGRKSHTTVVHACRRTRTLLVKDATLARDVEQLRRQLRPG
jgi:chromosomal replication initiator protein